MAERRNGIQKQLVKMKDFPIKSEPFVDNCKIEFQQLQLNIVRFTLLAPNALNLLPF